MLRRIAFSLVVTLLFVVGARSGEARKLNIVASFYPMYVAALNVADGVPGVQVTCLTEPFAGCLHDYQLKPADIKTLAGADVFVANGAGMESFLDKVVSQLPKVQVIRASDGVKLLPDGNAHVWVSPSGAIEQIRQIAAGLSKIDPSRSAVFNQNADAYIARIAALRDEMKTALAGVKSRNIITFHEAFPYFAAEFDLNIVGVVEREPGAEPNARELAETIKLIRSHKAAALFAEPQYPAKSAEVIARETGIKLSFLDPVVTGPLEPAKAREHYLKTMRANLDTLTSALAN